MSAHLRLAVLASAAALVLAACGDDTTAGTGGDRPTVVVSTPILGDVVAQVTGGQVQVETIMPVGADPHGFAASADQVNRMLTADALIVNGEGFEEGLLDVIESASADGVATLEAVATVPTIDFGAGAEHSEDGGEHGDGEGTDPHFFLDPARTAVAAEAIGRFVGDTVDGVDEAALEAATTAYVAELEALDAEVEDLLAVVEDRALVTNHDALGYFADRYGFEVVGTVIPGGSTTDGTSARDLAELARTVRAEGVRAVFADTSASKELADALADEVGEDIAVVELYTESLGDAGSGAETYVGMIRTNAQRVADALR